MLFAQITDKMFEGILPSFIGNHGATRGVVALAVCSSKVLLNVLVGWTIGCSRFSR